MARTVLITGANRGLGRGLAEVFLSRDDTTVVAAVRDVNHPTAKSLSEAAKGKGSKVVLVKVESKSLGDAQAAVDELKSKHGISSLDLVIANAAISTVYPEVATAKIEDVREHFEINVLGPVALFQAVQPLLLASKNKPIFVTMSSSAGSIAGIELRPVPNAAYGTSKAALNYLTRKIHFENESLCAFCVDPGWVQTDMGNSAAVKYGINGGKAETPIEDSIKGLLSVIDGATRESHSGKFWMFTGELSPW